jgi:hypothetical protein
MQFARALQQGSELTGRMSMQDLKSADGLQWHHHQDYYNVINGIHYVQINSMSYQWMGADYARAHYDAAIESAYLGAKYTAPYEEPIWAF